jgi:hypothetical protein
LEETAEVFQAEKEWGRKPRGINRGLRDEMKRREETISR